MLNPEISDISILEKRTGSRLPQ